MDYLPASIAASNTFAAISGVFIGVGLVVILYRRLYANPPDIIAIATANIQFIFRIGILQAVMGLFGLLFSFSFITSLLTMSCGIVVFSTMRNLKSANEISRGRKAACSLPLHSANLALAAVVFGVFELIVACALHVLLVPNIYSQDTWCKGSASTWVSCKYYFDDVSCLAPVVALYHKSYVAILALQKFPGGTATIRGYVVDSVTASLLNLILNVLFLIGYFQVAHHLGVGAALVCCCWHPASDRDALNDELPLSSTGPIGAGKPPSPYHPHFMPPALPASQAREASVSLRDSRMKHVPGPMASPPLAASGLATGHIELDFHSSNPIGRPNEYAESMPYTSQGGGRGGRL